MEYLSLIPAAALGYLTSRTLTHPTRSRIRRKMPNIKIRRIQLFPVLRIKAFGSVIHLHHWIYFSVILVVSFFVSLWVVDMIVTKGFLLGAIVQGLTVPKRHRKIIYKNHPLIEVLVDKDPAK